MTICGNSVWANRESLPIVYLKRKSKLVYLLSFEQTVNCDWKNTTFFSLD